MRPFCTYLEIHLLFYLFLFIISCKGQQPSHSNSKQPDSIESANSALKFSSRIGIIFEDSQGNMWFVSHSDGVCRYDGKQFTYFTDKQGLAPVRAIHEADNGDLWFGIEDGVSIFDGQTFTTIHPEKESLLITESFQPSVHNFKIAWKKEREHFWFSAFNKNGVYRFDGEKLMHLTLPVPANHPIFDDSGYHPEEGWTTYAVYGIYKDNDGNMWFGTPGAGLFRYDGKSLVCINENGEKGVVRAIHQDQTGIIWFGNNAKGVYCYDGKDLVNFSELRSMYDYGLVSALDIEEDDNGNLWFGQYDNGLWRYNPATDQAEPPFALEGNAWAHYTKENGLDTNYISTLYTDSKGRLWIGTGKGSVFIFNGKLFDRFTRE